MNEYNPFSLAGKVILVIGASSGIGRGIAIECSKMGAIIILNGRNEERLLETQAMLKGEGHRIVICDIANQGEIENLVDLLPEIDGCVVSAGIPDVSPIKFYKREKVENLFYVNAIAPMMIVSQLLKKKRIHRGASIVLISAISGVFVGTKGDTAYCSTKGAVSGFTKASALELSVQGIRVNSVNPGLVPTNILKLTNNLMSDEEELKQKVSDYPLNRLGKSEDIAYGVIYLLSDASSWVTGINLPIDGGYILV